MMIFLIEKNPALRMTTYAVLKVGSWWKKWAWLRAPKPHERREHEVGGVCGKVLDLWIVVC